MEKKMSPKFGLGRGLADLKAEMGKTPDISVLSGEQRVAVRNISIGQLAPNPDQPRKTFTQQELQNLADSIREKGVLQPILVRHVAGNGVAHGLNGATGGTNQYEIVAGERRWRASQIAGLAEIPALVKNLTTENMMEIALIENVQRENLNAIEEANAYENLMQKCGYELIDVAKLIGKSESYLRNILRLTALPESVKQMVIDGQLSATHARTLAVAENPAALAKKIIAENMSVAATEELVKKAPRSKKSLSFSSFSDESAIKKHEQNIKKAIGFKTVIKTKRGGAGQVVIYFENQQKMEKLTEILTGGAK
jgi:ParB family chromosome partitioning protein